MLNINSIGGRYIDVDNVVMNVINSVPPLSVSIAGVEVGVEVCMEVCIEVSMDVSTRSLFYINYRRNKYTLDNDCYPDLKSELK